MHTPTKKTGYYVSLEGIDGTGKTSILAAMKEREIFQQSTVYTRMPGGTAFAERHRHACLSENLRPQTQCLFYSALNTDSMDRIIHPALNDGRLVVSDRGFGSTFSYNGMPYGAEGLVCGMLENLEEAGFRFPDLTIYLTIDMETAQYRESGQGRDSDRYASFDRKAKETVKEAYDLLYTGQRETTHLDMSDQNRWRHLNTAQRLLARNVAVVPTHGTLDQVIEHCYRIIDAHHNHDKYREYDNVWAYA